VSGTLSVHTLTSCPCMPSEAPPRNHTGDCDIGFLNSLGDWIRNQGTEEDVVPSQWSSQDHRKDGCEPV
jgi:hypothetical protein